MCNQRQHRLQTGQVQGTCTVICSPRANVAQAVGLQACEHAPAEDECDDPFIACVELQALQ